MIQLTGLDDVLGVELLAVSADEAVSRFTIGDRHLQPFGLPHGGVYCAVHESMASTAGQAWLGERGVVVGTNNTTDFLRQAAVGDVVTVTATPIHRGRSQQLWRVESRTADGRLVAQGQVRLANLDQELPAGASAALRSQGPEA